MGIPRFYSVLVLNPIRTLCFRWGLIYLCEYIFNVILVVESNLIISLVLFFPPLAKPISKTLFASQAQEFRDIGDDEVICGVLGRTDKDVMDLIDSALIS